MSLKERFFDFEVFPNWWSVAYGDYDKSTFSEDTFKKGCKVITSDMPNARQLMIDMFDDEHVHMGYNIKYYDLVIAYGIWANLDCRQLKIVNDLIINPGLQFSSNEHRRLFSFTKRKYSPFAFQDLLDDATGSLKEKEAVLGLDIEESVVPFDKEVLTEQDKADILYYNVHDVYSTAELYHKARASYVNNKLVIAKTFNIPTETAYKVTNANLCGKALNATKRSYTDEERPDIEIPERVKGYIYDNLPLEIVLHIENTGEQLKTKLFSNDVVFGSGGIHSVIDENLYVEESDDYKIINIDATSYYPSEMIELDLLSRSIPDSSKFKNIFDERVRIKHLPKDQQTEDTNNAQLAYKLVLNTVFGASMNKYLAIYDPWQGSRVCRVGQLLLAALATKLFAIPNTKIIQSNTDGIMIYTHTSNIDTIKGLMNEWTNTSGINMEMEYVKRIWQKNVNNYLEEDSKGNIKCKGAWLNSESIKIAAGGAVTTLDKFVCTKAVKDYLLNNKDILTSILSCNNIFDFAMFCKKGPTFSGVVQRMTDGTEVPLLKCNRVYASKDKTLGPLYKIKNWKGERRYNKMPDIPEYCRLINKKLISYDFAEIKKDIDYAYYVNNAYQLICDEWKFLKGNKITKGYLY